MKKIVLLFVLFISVVSCCFAHSGRTDSNGGHYNRSTGEYHYHHGYSEHQHINGICPYLADISELLPEKCPQCNDIINVENGFYCFECAYSLIPETAGIMKIVDGPAKKTRSEYFNEVQTLDNKINNLQSQIYAKENTIENLNEELEAKNVMIEELEVTEYVLAGILIVLAICRIVKWYKLQSK